MVRRYLYMHGLFSTSFQGWFPVKREPIDSPWAPLPDHWLQDESHDYAEPSLGCPWTIYGTVLSFFGGVK